MVHPLLHSCTQIAVVWHPKPPSILNPNVRRYCVPDCWSAAGIVLCQRHWNGRRLLKLTTFSSHFETFFECGHRRHLHDCARCWPAKPPTCCTETCREGGPTYVPSQLPWWRVAWLTRRMVRWIYHPTHHKSVEVFACQQEFQAGPNESIDERRGTVAEPSAVFWQVSPFKTCPGGESSGRNPAESEQLSVVWVVRL